MGWLIAMAFFAAFGCFCALWTVLGWLIPTGEAIPVCFCGSGSGAFWTVLRYRWLKESGLLRGGILLVDLGLSREEKEELGRIGRGVEFCSPEELPSRLELERK